MARARIPETGNGIQDAFDVTCYDQMMRKLRDRGWMETKHLLKAGIRSGCVLEIGPGPGYLGLEWLRLTENTELIGLDISPEMLKVAEKNAREYGLERRIRYVIGSALKLPFDDGSFDGVFTNGSLHEWSDPKLVFNEIHRVLKSDGRYCVSDLRRNMLFVIRWLLLSMTEPKEMRAGLMSSINAAYTLQEIRTILDKTSLLQSFVEQNVLGLLVSGKKA